VRGASITVIKILTATITVAFAALLSIQNSQSKQLYLLSAASPVVADGAVIYAEHCAKCHGGDGRAQTAKGKRKGATDFTSAKWKPNDARMIKVITDGKGNMPGFKETLNEDEIRAAMLFVKTFKK